MSAIEDEKKSETICPNNKSHRLKDKIDFSNKTKKMRLTNARLLDLLEKVKRVKKIQNNKIKLLSEKMKE